MNLIDLLRSAFPEGTIEEESRGDRPPAIRVSATADAFDAFQSAMDALVTSGALDPTQTFIVFHEV